MKHKTNIKMNNLIKYINLNGFTVKVDGDNLHILSPKFNTYPQFDLHVSKNIDKRLLKATFDSYFRVTCRNIPQYFINNNEELFNRYMKV